MDSYADSTKGTLNAYDSRGNLTYERNSQGVVTHFAYSDTNKLVREAFDKYVFAYDYQIEPSELDGQTVSYIRTITVAGQNYATEYYTDKDLLIAKAFANGQALRYNYNEDGDLTAQYHDSDETPFVTYTYDSEGALQSKTNTDTGLRTVYTGDLTEVYQIASDGTETLYYSYSNEETTDSGKTTRIYSANTLGTEVSRKVTDNTASYTAGSHAFTVQSAEDNANRTATETLTAGDKTLGTTSRTYDKQGRVTAETITYGENQLYLSYQYDDQGRLTYYRQGRDADKDNDAQISRYQYDSKGQLVRENIFFDNDRAGITRTYTYDKRGNITSAKTYKYNTGDLSDQTPTKSYTCTYKSGDDVWEDELVNATAIDENSSLLYDANGNPLNYSEAAVRWSAGRQLSKISGVEENGNEEVYASFIYDENGIRTSEQSTEPGLSWDFTTEDGVVTGRQNDNGKNYRFIYDESGRPTAFMLNDALYHYITNQMGDVIGVADADGNLALEYFYDAWGDNFTARPTPCDYDGKTGWDGVYRLYDDNPIKYRGYYFDHAIGMYYLQSRYFHTDINRFFNADDPDIARESKDLAVGMNLFAYCNNNPVNNVDFTGYWTSKVHYGYNSKSSNHYYAAIIQNYATFYGTYYWAINCGFRNSDAKSIGKYCNELDAKYPSTTYATALASGYAYPSRVLDEYRSWQYWHFNGNAKGKDSREVFAEQKLNSAVNLWKRRKKNDALRALGYGLHALQDKEAHGNMGKGKVIPVQRSHADDINYIWKDGGRVKLKKGYTSKKRLYDTQNVTRNYLNKFISRIGGKGKLK